MVRISLLTYLALGLGSTTVLADCGQAPSSSPAVQIPTGVLTPVTDFGVNPTGLDLHIYVPKNLAPKPAVILALHLCGGTGPIYSYLSNYNPHADQRKNFVVLYPSTPHDNHCWDVASKKSLTRDAGGDTTSLASMVRWAISEFDADPAKVFVTGSSSGCMMSNVMAAAYPDIFSAVSCYSGIPAGCLAGSPGASPQNSDPTCGQGKKIKSGEEWAAVLKSIYGKPEGYTEGSYPKVQTWHGEADFFVNYPNLQEQLKQWSTVLDVPFSKTQANAPDTGYTKIVYGDGSKLVGYSAKGVGHTVPVHPEEDLKWFGL
ncbi:carbohydrate esterase family 1 protein [Neurospora crassa]|uniref:Carboxylic ester hydrolase n=1 Tax=Neurospora crassa (strain ATCC 24698 / 74-OR23-1A / CBS 708.71 / DSM 1257 / FGSC 987) TaxID=367110 RepID=Q7RYB3_NEUCR|nr:acetyl xylan esterase [Neurospora crassa OR74A]EAA27827.1 acetyl xylan esterase [Neurospora crassa OR74A]KHE88657.1 carbohydrate esterase family 1 protein [Neurospora crassa]|eukprot:XP_957063.1 acetyl xylan esterase [Neurospora crassa OR74A]